MYIVRLLEAPWSGVFSAVAAMPRAGMIAC